MNPTCRTEDLEALVRSELAPEQAAAVAAHATSCPACQCELSWLRTEHALLQKRRPQPLPPQLWAGLAERLEFADVDRRGAGPWGWFFRAPIWALCSAAAAVLLLLGVVSSRVAGRHHPAGPGSHRHRSFSFHFGSHHGGGRLLATTAVAGPVGFRLHTRAADVALRAGAPGQVRLTVEDSPAGAVQLVPAGEGRLEVRFDGFGALPSGMVEVELPAGSSLDLDTASGSIRAEGPFAAARLRTGSGDMDLHGVDAVEAQSASGDLRVEAVRGKVRFDTASGDLEVDSVPDPARAPELDYRSASGDLRWRGACKAGCRLEMQSASGECRFDLARDSSFALRYSTHSGDLEDHLGLSTTRSGDVISGHYGQGQGTVSCATVSGDLELQAL